jgi:hypothetical protein
MVASTEAAVTLPTWATTPSPRREKMAHMANDLVTFLRSRLDEEEQLAHAASPAPWSANAEHDEVLAADGETVADGFALSSSKQLRATVDHIVRHDPARVLREVEAKRRILDDLERFIAGGRDLPTDERAAGKATASGIVRLLALPYSDHPAYRAEWRP